MELQPNDLEALKEKFPNVSFIYVFQTTKEGNFRGSNHFQHDVGVEVPEKGKAVQNDRFNQGGKWQGYRMSISLKTKGFEACGFSRKYSCP